MMTVDPVIFHFPFSIFHFSFFIFHFSFFIIFHLRFDMCHRLIPFNGKWKMENRK